MSGQTIAELWEQRRANNPAPQRPAKPTTLQRAFLRLDQAIGAHNPTQPFAPGAYIEFCDALDALRIECGLEPQP